MTILGGREKSLLGGLEPTDPALLDKLKAASQSRQYEPGKVDWGPWVSVDLASAEQYLEAYRKAYPNHGCLQASALKRKAEEDEATAAALAKALVVDPISDLIASASPAEKPPVFHEEIGLDDWRAKIAATWGIWKIYGA